MTHAFFSRAAAFAVSAFCLAPATASARAPGAAARSAETRADATPRPAPGEVGGGSLIYEGAGDDAWLAPQVGNHVELSVTGLVARTRVHQVFDNPTDQVINAIYAFPLPEMAAVDGLELLVGERRIVGEIQERGQARRTYEKAVSEGKKASLLDQERPNLFSTRVANVGPGETVEVTLSYQQEVRYEDGTFSLHFPSTLTPRYVGRGTEPARPARGEKPAGFQPTGWGPTVVADAERISPPMSLSGDGPWLDVELTLDAGVPIERVESPTHAVQVTPTGQGAYRVALARGPVLADRDFALRWRPKLGDAPTSALFEETFDGERYALLMLLPPDAASAGADALPKQTTFVIDTSGSMSGTSIAQARSSLSIGLGSLSPRDHFNVIAFDSTARALFEAPQPASPTHVNQALDWVRTLDAQGGTEMLSALSLALAPEASESTRLSQVVFVTDGSVGNEADVLSFIRRNLGNRRLFTVGIGSAPNRHFMRGAARFGRGTFTHVTTLAEVGNEMNRLWAKLEAPVLSDLKLSFAGAPAETYPERSPDLYRGQPLVAVAKLGPGASSLNVQGRRAGLPFETSLSARGGKHESGIHRLWARRKIETLMDSLLSGTDEAQVEREVIELSRRHHLVTKYTSLVAVEERRSVETPGTDAAVALAMPAGNSMFGALPQTATPGPFCLLTGLLTLASSALIFVRGGA